MELHKNARTCPASRMLMIRRIQAGIPVTSAAEAAGVSRRSASKWKSRYREAGEAALMDRSSRPHRSPRQTHTVVVEEILRLRRRRQTGQQIASRVGSSPSTVARVLAREGLSRLKNLDPKEPVRRYQRDHPGELIHIDIKKLGRAPDMPVGSLSMSPSTTPPVWLMPRSWLTRDHQPLSPSLDDWSPGTPVTA